MVGLLVDGEDVYVNKDNVEMIEPASRYDNTRVYLMSGKIIIVDRCLSAVKRLLEER